MTEKQIERIKVKIKKIKAALAADKKRCGGYYDDSRGLRYVPPQYYIQMGDFSGGLRYVNWFNKTFPDDMGFPDFLFEWTIILFKTGRLKEAEKKAFQTFCQNTYLFDKFFNKEIVPIDKWEGSNLEVVDYARNSFHYTHTQENLTDFSAWLSNFIQTDKFIQVSEKLIDFNKRLKNEQDRESRRNLIKAKNHLEKDFE